MITRSIGTFGVVGPGYGVRVGTATLAGGKLSRLKTVVNNWTTGSVNVGEQTSSTSPVPGIVVVRNNWTGDVLVGNLNSLIITE